MSMYHFGIHCISCSDEIVKSMQLVVTAISVVASIISCQVPIPEVRLNDHCPNRAARLISHRQCNAAITN